MKAESKEIEEKIYFDNFVVAKESDTFYGVYQKFSKYWLGYNKNNLITSGATKESACKKAKLLQIGYDIGLSDARERF